VASIATDLVKIIKKAAKEAVADAKPADICVAQVEGVSPVTLRINEVLTLSEAALYPTRILAQLNVGDKVVLLSGAGGQKYIVLDVMQ
jgi:hypothetical protein